MKRKYLVKFLIIISILGSLFMIGCKKKNPVETEDPVYYYVTFDENNGKQTSMVRVEANKLVEKPSNDPVKEGYTFLYWTMNDEEYDFSSPVTNHITLIAKYEEVAKKKTTRIIWSEDESSYYSFDGSVPRTVEVGTLIKFKVVTSPYYEGDLEVIVDNKIIEPDEDGYYNFTAEDVTSMNVYTDGLVKQNDKIKGHGTEDSPYHIANASQFKAFIDGVNSLTDTRYNEAYVVLDNDIDFNGYAIDVIGTRLNYNHFSGKFDGQNHTIANFTLNEEEGMYGLFGYLVTAEITNLTVNNDLVVTPTSSSYNLVGGIVAYNIASDIMNCHFNGSITVNNELQAAAEVYVGGIVGYMQSYSTTYSSVLCYATSNALINSSGKTEVTSMGGLVGLILGSDESVPAFIYNSVFKGSITGASLSSGGIVGTLCKFSAIANSYSDGLVEALSDTRDTAAGGIAGTAENETAISYSFSTSKLTSSNPNTNEYAQGNIVGASYLAGSNNMDDQMIVIVDSYYSVEGTITVNEEKYDLHKYEDIVKLLKWSTTDWDESINPTIETGETTEFKVIFDFGRDVTNEGNDSTMLTQKVDEVTIQGFLPIYWVYDGSGMNTFVADDGTISYGFFLDEARTVRVPSSFVVTQNTTIYVGFADYTEVVGDYYLSLNDTEIKLTFEPKGKMVMSYDAIIANYMYVYDGNKITIKEGYFAYIEYPSFIGNYDLDVDYYAVIENGTLVIYNDDFFPKDGLEIIAYKHNLAMGTWYSNDNSIYTFLSDGTGIIDNGSSFIYECNDHSVRINIGNETINAQISSDKTMMEASNGMILSLTKFDEYMGTWESEFKNPDEISFDGKGKVTYQNQTYDYVIDENNILTFSNYQAYFNEDNLLVLEYDNHQKVFGQKGSYIGTWYDTTLDYWIIFEGINKDGVGFGYDSFGFDFTYNNTSESNEQVFINLFYGTTMYGYGGLAIGNDGSEMLQLAIYTPSSGMIVDDYNVSYMDPFFGTWNGSDGLSFEFNGLGAYDIYVYLNTLGEYWDVRGYVSITENDTTTNVRYYFNRSTGIGTFEYKNESYQVSISDGKLLINTKEYLNPDGLNDYDYQVDDLIFKFNGKSNVDLGIVEISSVNSTKEYKYQYNNNMVSIYDQNVLIYTITIGDKYELEDIQTSNSYELGLYHVLMNKTYTISSDSTLIFNQSFDINGIASGTMHMSDKDTEIKISYIDKLTIALYYNGSFLYYVYYLDEQCAALCDYSFTPVSVIAIGDELRGEWTSSNNDKIIFSGLSYASDYVEVDCKVSETDETGTYMEEYLYESLGQYYVIYYLENGVQVEKYYVYTEYVENATAYQQNDKIIYVVEVVE